MKKTTAEKLWFACLIGVVVVASCLIFGFFWSGGFFSSGHQEKGDRQNSRPSRTSLHPEYTAKAFVYPGTAENLGTQVSNLSQKCQPSSGWNQFPPVTNWKRGQGFFKGGQDPYDLKSMCTEAGARFAAKEMPDYEQPVGANHSILAGLLSDGKSVETWMTQVANSFCLETGTVVRFLKAGEFKSVREEVRKNPEALHVLIGYDVEESFSIVMLPPGWSPQDQAGAHPILAHSMSDPLETFGQNGDFMLRLIAESAARPAKDSGTKSRKSFMGLIWNGGGSEGTLGVNTRARYQFSRILAMLEEDWGGDRQNVITFGESRGATTALMMAANPENFDYRVRYVHAVSPIVKFGSWIDLAQNSLPMGPYAFLALGFDRSWAPGWTYPKNATCSERELLYGMNAPTALKQILLGQTETQKIDELYALSSERLVQAIKNQETHVFLDLGAADGFVPFAHNYEYFRKLKSIRVNVEARVTLHQGHQGTGGLVGGAKIREAMLILSENRPRKFLENGQMKVFEHVSGQEQAQEVAPYSARLPLTIQAPVRAVAGWATQFLLTGTSGTEFELVFKRGDVTLPPEDWFVVWTGKINEFGTAKIDWTPQDIDLGTLSLYTLKTKEPLQDWKMLTTTKTNTLTALPLQTQVVSWSEKDAQLTNAQGAEQMYATLLNNGKSLSDNLIASSGATLQLVADEIPSAPALAHEDLITKIKNQFNPQLQIETATGPALVTALGMPQVLTVTEGQAYVMKLQLQGYPAGRIKTCELRLSQEEAVRDCLAFATKTQEMVLLRNSPSQHKQSLKIVTVDGKEVHFKWELVVRIMTFAPSIQFQVMNQDQWVQPLSPQQTITVHEAKGYQTTSHLNGYPAARLTQCVEENLTAKTSRDCLEDFKTKKVSKFLPQASGVSSMRLMLATSEGQRALLQYQLKIEPKPFTLSILVESRGQKLEMGPKELAGQITLTENEPYTLMTKMNGYPAEHVTSCQWQIEGGKAQNCLNYFQGDKKVPSLAGRAGKTKHSFVVGCRDGQKLQFELTLEVLKKPFAPQIKLFGNNQAVTLSAGSEATLRLDPGQRYSLTVSLNGFAPKKIKSCSLESKAGPVYDCLGYFQKPQTYSFQAGAGSSEQIFRVVTDEGESADFKLKIDTP